MDHRIKKGKSVWPSVGVTARERAQGSLDGPLQQTTRSAGGVLLFLFHDIRKMSQVFGHWDGGRHSQ